MVSKLSGITGVSKSSRITRVSKPLEITKVLKPLGSNYFPRVHKNRW